MTTETLTLKSTDGYQYVEEGPATEVPPIICLHGLLGDHTNWQRTVRALSAAQYRVLVPSLPIHGLPMKRSNVDGLVQHVAGFIEALELERVVLAGNSLGGQVALFYALRHADRIAALVLSGSSGIYEVETGTTTLRRKDRAFIRERAARTFYDPIHATDALVEQAYEMVNDRGTALRLIRMARSAQSKTVTDDLARIPAPTLLLWGREDRITPPDVAEVFRDRLPCAELHFIDRCGHAPMMEHPEAFNAQMLTFLHQTIGQPTRPALHETP